MKQYEAVEPIYQIKSHSYITSGKEIHFRGKVLWVSEFYSKDTGYKSNERFWGTEEEFERVNSPMDDDDLFEYLHEDLFPEIEDDLSGGEEFDRFMLDDDVPDLDLDFLEFEDDDEEIILEEDEIA